MTPNRPVYVALAIALIALVVGFSAIASYTVVSNGDRIGEINQSRYENTLTACQARNTQNRTLIAFVAGVQPRAARPRGRGVPGRGVVRGVRPREGSRAVTRCCAARGGGSCGTAS